MSEQEMLLQGWIADFEDIHGRQPKQETVMEWMIEISELHPYMIDDDE